MPHFRFVVLDPEGREEAGLAEAADLRAAAAGLRCGGRMLLELEEVPGGSPGGGEAGPPGSGLFPRAVRTRDRVFLFRQLALMLRTGIPLLSALESLSRHSRSRRLARSLERMAGAIRRGAGLSRAMAAEGGLFPPFAVRLVESAEATGELDPALEEIAVHLERGAEVRNRLLTSLAYPAVVLAAALGVAAFLVAKVIPKFASFFARQSLPVPPMMAFLLDASAWLRANAALLLFVVALLAAAAAAAASTARGRRALDGAALRVPVLGPLLGMSSMARAARSLAALLRSGVTLLESLRVARGVVGNRAMAAGFEEAAGRVLRGRSLAEGLTGPHVPPLVPQVVAVGERTGALAEVLDNLGLFYERELEASVRRLGSLVEPALLVVVGGMVGFVYVAFFEAVFRLVQR